MAAGAARSVLRLPAGARLAYTPGPPSLVPDAMTQRSEPDTGLSTLDELRAGAVRLVGAALGVGLGIAGLLTYNSGLFVTALREEIGLSRTTYGAIFFGATVAMCLAMPLVARLVETRGARFAALSGALMLAIGFAALSRVGSVAAYGVVMVLTGLFAAASAPVAHTRAVAQSFSRARGLALGLTQLGIGLAAALVPPLVTTLIDAQGWRAGFLALAGLALLGVVPALALPGRNAQERGTSGGSEAAEAYQTMRGQNRFRVQIIAFSTMALAFAGMLSHFVPMLLDGGVAIRDAGRLAGLIGLSVIVTRVLIGWLSDRIEPALLASASCLICAAGCLTLALGGAGMAMIGAPALGAEADLIAILTARNFPLGAYSRAYSVQYAAFTIAAGISPLWVGMVADATGDYRAALLACTVLLMLPAALFGIMARAAPVRRSPSAALD
jgi:predicted MFS family arabinose efflux permease